MTVRSTNEGNEGKSLSEPASPNVKLYVVVACIAALVLVAIVQVGLSPFVQNLASFGFFQSSS